MNSCSQPPALDTVQLTAFLAGEDDPKTADHLRTCTFCRQQAQAIADDDYRLRALLFRVHCPPAESLQDYVFDLLPTLETDALTSHLRSCPHCTHDLFQLEDFLLSIQSAPATKPDKRASTDIASAMLPSQTFVHAQMDRLRFLVATLFNPPSSSSASALGGIRGASDELLYQADGIDIGLSVEPDQEHPDQRLLLGSLLGLEETDWHVYLWHLGKLIASAPVDDLGSFGIGGLPPGSYALILGNADFKVLIPGLSVH